MRIIREGETPCLKALTKLTSSSNFVPVQHPELRSAAKFLDATIRNLREELRKAENARAALEDKTPPATKPMVLAGRPRQQGSTGDHLMKILCDGGPLSVKEIQDRILAKGKMIEYHALSSMVSYYQKRGYIRRTGPGIYEVAADTPLAPSTTNGAPVPKALR
jgi:hypothetical protein